MISLVEIWDTAGRALCISDRRHLADSGSKHKKGATRTDKMKESLHKDVCSRVRHVHPRLLTSSRLKVGSLGSCLHRPLKLFQAEVTWEW